MSDVNEVSVFTTTLNNEIFSIPKGSRTIDLNNTGLLPCTVLGNVAKGGKLSTPTSIGSSLSYSFGDLNKPYPEIIIDAIGTSVELIVNY